VKLLPALRVLHIPGGGGSVHEILFLSALSAMTCLTRLTLERWGGLGERLAHLPRSLLELDLREASRLALTGNGALAHVSHLTGLTALSLRGCKVLDADVALLAPLSQLQRLNLSRCRSLRGAFLDALAPAVGGSLRQLDLGYDRGLAATRLGALSALTRLETLTLSYCRSLAGLGHCVSALASLTRLDVRGSIVEASLEALCAEAAPALVVVRTPAPAPAPAPPPPPAREASPEPDERDLAPGYSPTSRGYSPMPRDYSPAAPDYTPASPGYNPASPSYSPEFPPPAPQHYQQQHYGNAGYSPSPSASPGPQ
jgi:hypothetical protein